MPPASTANPIALNAARAAGVNNLVYLSVIHSDVYVNVPHFAGKFGVACMIEQMGFEATILRPAYFINNDLTELTALVRFPEKGRALDGARLVIGDARDETALRQALKGQDAVISALGTRALSRCCRQPRGLWSAP